MTHTRWKQLTTLPLTPDVVRDQLLYVRGYMLALEDMLTELKAAQSGFAYTSPVVGVAFDTQAETIKRMLREAKATERALLKMKRSTKIEAN